MELIQTDIYGKELGYVMNANIDFEVGAEEKDSINDFELEFKALVLGRERGVRMPDGVA